MSSLTFRQMLGNGTLWLLFATGLTSMGMEVVWIRQYTIFVGTFVYSFATILGVYLAATFIEFQGVPSLEQSSRKPGISRSGFSYGWLP